MNTVILCDDGVLQALLYKDGWVFVRWLSNKHGRLQKQLVLDLIWVEQYILEQHLKGWFTSSEVDHSEFHHILKRVGAKPYMRDAAFIYFNKWITKAEDIFYVRKSTRRTSITPIS